MSRSKVSLKQIHIYKVTITYLIVQVVLSSDNLNLDLKHKNSAYCMNITSWSIPNDLLTDSGHHVSCCQYLLGSDTIHVYW